MYNYVARYGGHHACVASTEADQLISRFLSSEAKLSACIQAMFASIPFSTHANYSQQVPKYMIGVHGAAYLSLEEVTLALLKTRHDPEARDIHSQKPLSQAASRDAIVKLLLEKKVEVDLKDSEGRTPLSWVAEKWDEAAVKLLLEIGKIDIDSKDKIGRTPLSWAAESGKEAVVQLLLERGADIETKETGGQTPLP